MKGNDEKILQPLKVDAAVCLTENILPFWLSRMQDFERGGWYGRMTGRYELVPDAPRGAVLYCRLLWAFSAAYRVVGRADYLAAATRTKDYILRHFLDREYGGVYWSITADGLPLELTPVAFSRFFRQRTGRTLSDYIVDTRIGSAARLLVDTEKTVAEICYDCGFNTLSNFNRLFRRKKNCSPKEFREYYKKYKVLV